jgi:AmmeMemoRadiSam system protein A
VSGLGGDERRALLQIARAAVEAELRREAPPALPAELSPSLRRPGGAFVTLNLDNDLRGCIGHVESRYPLAETVARVAASATHDRRFPPLRVADAERLDIEVSVLSPLVPILPQEVEIGVHGLAIDCDGRSGLLLPQVPVSYGWNRETFLEHLCQKASLPPDRWRHAEAHLLGFTAQVFGERE